MFRKTRIDQIRQIRYVFIIAIVSKCNPLAHPHPIKTDQHSVVTITLPNTPVTILGVSRNLMTLPLTSALTRVLNAFQLNPVGGLCSPLLYSGYQLHFLFCQLGQPI